MSLGMATCSKISSGVRYRSRRWSWVTLIRRLMDTELPQLRFLHGNTLITSIDRGRRENAMYLSLYACFVRRAYMNDGKHEFRKMYFGCVWRV